MPELTALGGFDAKGPACFLLDSNGRRLLLDLGQGPDDDRRPDPWGVGSAEAVPISHGHGDHVGALDLVRRSGNPGIFATAPDCSYGVQTEAPEMQARALPRTIGDGPCLLPAPPDGRGWNLRWHVLMRACRSGFANRRAKRSDHKIHAMLTAAPHRRMENGEIRRWSPVAQWNCHQFFKPRA